MSPTTRRILIGGALTLVFAGVGAGIGVAQDTGPDSDDAGDVELTDDVADVELTGDTLTRAGEAALEQTGGGEVVDSETEDYGYEVEVNLDDGRQMEVHLDASYAVIGSEENAEGDDGD